MSFLGGAQGLKHLPRRRMPSMIARTFPLISHSENMIAHSLDHFKDRFEFL
jgi:hypothetical protein